MRSECRAVTKRTLSVIVLGTLVLMSVEVSDEVCTMLCSIYFNTTIAYDPEACGITVHSTTEHANGSMSVESSV